MLNKSLKIVNMLCIRVHVYKNMMCMCKLILCVCKFRILGNRKNTQNLNYIQSHHKAVRKVDMDEVISQRWRCIQP